MNDQPVVIRQRPWLALAVTLAVQTLAALSQSAPAVLAPVIAAQLQVGAQHIGNFTGILYSFAMLSGLLISGWISRFGAVRFSQLAMLLCASGLAIATLSGFVALALAAALIGTGYGLANPTAALILGRNAAANRRGLVFSIKQTGVPLGIAIAGVMVPFVLGLSDWRGALISVALLCVLCTFMLQPSAAALDAPSSASGALQRPSLTPLLSVLSHPDRRLLALTSLIYGFTQVCFLVFLVAFLTIDLQLQLTLAASVLAMAQLASVVGRPFWGWIADRSGKPGTLLGLLGIAMALACTLLANLSADTGSVRLFATAMFCGMTAVGWNGVFYAELVRQSALSELATLTGGVQFMTFAGAMIGPVIFALCVSLGFNYGTSFLMLSLLPLIAGTVLLQNQRAGMNSRTA